MYFGLGWIKTAFPSAAFSIVVVLCAGFYLGLAWVSSKRPDLVVDHPDAPITELPRAGETAIIGLYYVLPIVILIWCIVIERLSPAFSAFWAMIAITIVALTQHPIKAFFRKTGNFDAAFRKGLVEWKDGMIAGSSNMVAIAVATGAAGIIVGTISLTGAHQIVGEFVEFLSGGSLIAMLLLVAVMSLILGMGLPTTANYIVVLVIDGARDFVAWRTERASRSSDRSTFVCFLLWYSCRRYAASWIGSICGSSHIQR